MNTQIEQTKIAFPEGADCPYCGTHIDVDNPPVRLLISCCPTKEAYCSREHYELHNYGRVVNEVW